MCVTSVAKEKQENFTYFKKSASQKHSKAVAQQAIDSTVNTAQNPEVNPPPVDHSDGFHYQPSDKPFQFNFSLGDEQVDKESCKSDDSDNSLGKEGKAVLKDETEGLNYFKMDKSDNSFRFNFCFES